MKFSTFFPFAIFTVFGMTLGQTANDFDAQYKQYDMAVNHVGITYSENLTPCTDKDARCVIMHDFPGSGEDYDIEVLYKSTATCNRNYTLDAGKETQMTIYTGECVSKQATQYLITCRESRNNGEPDHNKGWAIVNLNDTISEFWGYQGTQARFKNSSAFIEHDISTDPNPQVQVRCSPDPTPITN